MISAVWRQKTQKNIVSFLSSALLLAAAVSSILSSLVLHKWHIICISSAFVSDDDQLLLIGEVELSASIVIDGTTCLGAYGRCTACSYTQEASHVLQLNATQIRFA